MRQLRGYKKVNEDCNSDEKLSKFNQGKLKNDYR